MPGCSKEMQTRIALLQSLARSSAADMSLCSIHFQLWLAMRSQPASFMAATSLADFSFSCRRHAGMTVVGSLRSVEHPPHAARSQGTASHLPEHRLDIGVLAVLPGAAHPARRLPRMLSGPIAVQDVALAALTRNSSSQNRTFFGDCGRCPAIVLDRADCGHSRCERSRLVSGLRHLDDLLEADGFARPLMRLSPWRSRPALVGDN